MAEEKDIIGAILSNPIFSNFHIDQVREVCKYFHKVNIKSGLPLFREGEIGDCMYFIAKGKVGIYKKTKNAKDITKDNVKIADLQIGDSVGELSLFDNYTRSATAIAETDCDLLRLSRTDFERMEKQNIEFSYKILKSLLKILSKRLRRTTDTVVDILKEEEEK